ncbi:hypothetical protein JTE90_014210 [Oedothorax gibbosus]|uniref:Uncharacterized protein n=1 Tax=Oedothorax gibbosus TaxID=931172 RepID=A0AAV6TI57_9ARAC|nr:hypothetical protein JTE90_014210 [Oedothorax gibbosus]
MEKTAVVKALDLLVSESKVKEKTYDKSLTTEAAMAELNALNKEIPQLKEKLHSLESNKSQVGPKEKEALYKAKMKYCKEWQKRKRLAKI